jgi:hypothetical protein
MQSGRMRWEEHAERMVEMKNASKILAGRSEGNGLLRKPKYRWDEYSTRILIEIGCEGVNWLRIRYSDGLL